MAHKKAPPNALVCSIFSFSFIKSKTTANTLAATNNINKAFCHCEPVVASANNDNKAMNACNIDKSRIFRHRCLYFN